MNGMRFGAGLLGGLLLGLVVIGSTGFLAFGTPAAATNSAGVPDTFRASSTASTTTSTASTSSTVAAVPGVGQVQTSTTSTVHLVLGNSTSSLSSSNGQPSTNAVFGFLMWGPPTTHAPSAVDSLTSQPSDVRLFLLVPVLVAFLLGAVYYRISAKHRDEE